MATMGRPSKLTPELTARLCAWLKAGNFVTTACDMEGIDYSTFHGWMKRGERGWKVDIDGGYVDFFNMVKRAKAEVEVTSVAHLRGGPKNWQATAWWLERSYPDKWGNRGKVNVEHSGQIDVRNLSDEELEAIIAGKSGG